MQLVPGTRDKYRVFAVVFVLLVSLIAITGAVFLGQHAANQVRTELRDRSGTIAAALNSDEIIRLSGTEKDENLLVYKQLKARLADIKKSNPTARSLYLTGERNGRLFFYVDSEKPDSRDYSPAGEYYDDATPEFKGMFETGETVVEGPVTDNFGTFISGLAPIFRTGTDEVIAVIGIDVAATTYYQAILQAAFLPLLTGIIIITIIVAFEWIRRRNQQLMTVRSELVSVASHELRTPIVGIKLAAENLERTVTDKTSQSMVRVIYDSARRLQNSTDDILELTRTMKKQKLALAETDMIAVIGEIVAMQQLAAQQKSVSIEYVIPWPAKLVLKIDADKMRRALHNIISNAIKYTREGTKVTIAYQADDKHHFFTVTDQGIGIPAEELGKVFAGFYRASNAVSSKIPGTGMGLYLVKAVVEQHGGRISCRSEQGKGASFSIILPK